MFHTTPRALSLRERKSKNNNENGTAPKEKVHKHTHLNDCGESFFILFFVFANEMLLAAYVRRNEFIRGLLSHRSCILRWLGSLPPKAVAEFLEPPRFLPYRTWRLFWGSALLRYSYRNSIIWHTEPAANRQSLTSTPNQPVSHGKCKPRIKAFRCFCKGFFFYFRFDSCLSFYFSRKDSETFSQKGRNKK